MQVLGLKELGMRPLDKAGLKCLPAVVRGALQDMATQINVFSVEESATLLSTLNRRQLKREAAQRNIKNALQSSTGFGLRKVSSIPFQLDNSLSKHSLSKRLNYASKSFSSRSLSSWARADPVDMFVRLRELNNLTLQHDIHVMLMREENELVGTHQLTYYFVVRCYRDGHFLPLYLSDR